MDSPDSRELEKARNYAFLLLKFRQRSEKELLERLLKKKFSADAAQKTLAFLKERSFVDDASFARAWVASRINKPLGMRRLKRELEAKGVAGSIIKKLFAELTESYSEKEVVLEAVNSRLARLAGVEPKKARQRLYAYLLRRGFSADVVIEVLNQFTL